MNKGPKYFWEVYWLVGAGMIIVAAYLIGFGVGIRQERNSWVQLQTRDSDK